MLCIGKANLQTKNKQGIHLIILASMIHYTKGNLLTSTAQALVNAVNIEGVMGKGIALQFKLSFPTSAKLYMQACKKGQLHIGELVVAKDFSQDTGEKMIIHFPTKTTWRKPSEYSYIEKGLKRLAAVIQEMQITSIAIPALGAGLGGLKWEGVKNLLEQYLSNVAADVYIYEPAEVV
jgi:O-acetyl-ADP-ribose deacetylase (regulator of RNase III)